MGNIIFFVATEEICIPEIDKLCQCIYNYVYTLIGALIMLTRVFKSGNSQAVRIPKDFQLDVEEVEIFARGDELIIKKSKP